MPDTSRVSSPRWKDIQWRLHWFSSPSSPAGRFTKESGDLWGVSDGVRRRLNRLQTGCCRSDLAGECRRTPIPDVGQFLLRLSAAPRNLTFGGGAAHRQLSDLATRSGQRLLPLAAIGRCRPLSDLRSLELVAKKRPFHHLGHPGWLALKNPTFDGSDATRSMIQCHHEPDRADCLVLLRSTCAGRPRPAALVRGYAGRALHGR